MSSTGVELAAETLVESAPRGVPWIRRMKVVADYLERAHRLERLANAEQNPRARKALQEQAGEYYDLAAKRAKKLNLPMPRDKLPHR